MEACYHVQHRTSDYLSQKTADDLLPPPESTYMSKSRQYLMDNTDSHNKYSLPETPCQECLFIYRR